MDEDKLREANHIMKEIEQIEKLIIKFKHGFKMYISNIFPFKRKRKKRRSLIMKCIYRWESEDYIELPRNIMEDFHDVLVKRLEELKKQFEEL